MVLKLLSTRNHFLKGLSVGTHLSLSDLKDKKQEVVFGTFFPQEKNTVYLFVYVFV